MKETKLDSMAIYAQVRQCLEDIDDEGFSLPEYRVDEIIEDHQGYNYGKEIVELADAIRANRKLRRAVFRLAALDSFGALDRSLRIIDSEREMYHAGRKSVFAIYTVVITGIILITHWNLSGLDIVQSGRYLLTITNLILGITGMGVVNMLNMTDVPGAYQREDGYDVILNEIYEAEDGVEADEISMATASNNNIYSEYDTICDYLPNEAFAIAKYLVELMENPRMTHLLGDRKFSDLFSKEYNKIYSEIGNCYRLFGEMTQEEIDAKIRENRSKNGGPQIYNLDKPQKKRKKKKSNHVKKISHNGKLCQFELEITHDDEGDK